MPLTYATASDLETFLGAAPDPVPAKLDRYLAVASALVRRATRAAVYDAGTTGAPSDPDVAEAFRDATCAQVAAWLDLDVHPTVGAGGLGPGVVQSSGIGGASVTYASAPQVDAKAATVAELVPEAWAYLADLPTSLTVWG